LPLNIDYDGIAGLSSEVKRRLERARPPTLAPAGRLKTARTLTLALPNAHRASLLQHAHAGMRQS
jgi:tRNA U34 5-carboxymethylaminomethyl modifying enzyme MnmG/GidA